MPPAGGYARIPAALREVPGWLLWKAVPVPGEDKPRKIPFYTNGSVRKGAHGSADDRAHLSTFDTALAAYKKGGYAGLGLAMLPEWKLVALDFDNCVKDGVVSAPVLELVGETYAEISPSGTGVRAFMRGACDNRKSLDKVPAVEFFHSKGFVTLTGRVLEACDLVGSSELVAEMSIGVKELYEERFGGLRAPGEHNQARALATSDAFDETALSTSTSTVDGLDLARAGEMLAGMDPDADYDVWLKIGMALHHQFAGEGAALELWDAWSRAGTKYRDRADLENRWAGFGKGSGGLPITARYLIRVARETAKELPYRAAAGWAAKISEAVDEFAVREQVCVEIRKDVRLGEMERDKLATIVQDRLKTLGAKYALKACRALVRRAHEVTTSKAAPGWMTGWVYVTQLDKFVRISSDEWVTAQGFCAKYNREIPPLPDGSRPSATHVALVDHKMVTATRPMYVPWEDPLFVFEGATCLNTYRPQSAPEAAASMMPAGLAAVKLVESHLELVCGGRKDVTAQLLRWLAHNVQHPGVKIRHVPLIKGVEGDGKSIIATLLSSVMGFPQVKQISPKVLGTDFTGWAEGAAVGALEEIRLAGHNRHDILNALKPYITNDIIEIHRKGVDSYTAMNTMNYVAFTNHADALPLNDKDRRWMIIFTPHKDLAEMAAKVGPLDAYFARLHFAIADHAPTLRRWLLGIDLSGFDRNAPAPMTYEKQMMIELQRTDDEEEVRELIEKGGHGFSSVILSSVSLGRATSLGTATIGVNRLLDRLGFRLWGRIKWQGEPHRVWYRDLAVEDLSNEKIRELLDATKGEGA